MKPPTTVYLKWDRYAALADFITARNGLEVPLSFEMPSDRTLPAVKNSVCDWPDRILVSTYPGMCAELASTDVLRPIYKMNEGNGGSR